MKIFDSFLSGNLSCVFKKFDLYCKIGIYKIKMGDYSYYRRFIYFIKILGYCKLVF